MWDIGLWFSFLIMSVLFSYQITSGLVEIAGKVFPLQYPGTVCIDLVEFSSEDSGAQYIGYVNSPQGMDLHESDVSTLTVENMTISLLLILRIRSD